MKTYTCFIDNRKAFNNVKHIKLMKVLAKASVPDLGNLFWKGNRPTQLGD